jgi:hypothetical protein
MTDKAIRMKKANKANIQVSIGIGSLGRDFHPFQEVVFHRRLPAQNFPKKIRLAAARRGAFSREFSKKNKGNEGGLSKGSGSPG